MKNLALITVVTTSLLSCKTREYNASETEGKFVKNCTAKHEILGTFCDVPAGTFMMGATEEDRAADPNIMAADFPSHQVTISKSFQMMEIGVTREMWIKMGMSTTKQYPWSPNPTDLAYPADKISYIDAQRFVAKLNAKDSKFNYSLPTEAQWEYAARAGETRPFPGGTVKTMKEYAWDYGTDKGSTIELQKAKLKKPNAWGIYDMIGNSYEWVSDWYGPYPSTPVVDPVGPAYQETPDNAHDPGNMTNLGERVFRSGCMMFWPPSPELCRFSRRRSTLPQESWVNFGFRLVRVIK